MEHTPGPWRVFTSRPLRIKSEGSPNVEPELIAQIPVAEFRDATPEQLANARLIAAAPELKSEVEALHKRLRVACEALNWINRELLDGLDAKAIQKFAAAKMHELQRPL